MNTPSLAFPFFILIHRGSEPWRPVMYDPGFIAAFSTTDAVRAFGDVDEGWEFRLVSRETLRRVADEFDRQGVRGACLNPVRGRRCIPTVLPQV